MTPVSASGPTVERLASDLLDRRAGDRLAEELRDWLTASARFRAFAEAHRAKIRKKLRTAGDAEALRDVRVELCVARLLLSDPRVELAFEAYGSGRGGPDFTVTYRGTGTFNLEVTRLRRVPGADGAPDVTTHGAPLLAKLRQLPPSAPNAVLIAVEGDGAEALDVAAETRALRSRADAKDESFFTRRGLDGTRGFYERYLRLGAVFVWCEDAAGDARATLWTNRSARIALPERASRACLRCLRTA
jgi:hypothetical protein